MNKVYPGIVLLGLLLVCLRPVIATPTENIGLDLVPAPGPVNVDGSLSGWDLSGSVFCTGAIETQRDDYAVWLAGMYDSRFLYIIARFKDKTPLNNPGQTFGSYGWNGDSLQIRTITHPGTANQLLANITGWKGSDGAEVVDIDYPGTSVHIANAELQGAHQAFSVDRDRSGYVQEIAIPWALLTKDGLPLRSGDPMRITFEANFTVGSSGRWTIKDVFQPDMSLDRIFTFMNSAEWGTATLTAQGNLPLRPVRVASGRTFPVHWENGLPTADWSGVFQEKQSPGFKKIEFTTPTDGYVSLNIFNNMGAPICQLLNSVYYVAGRHTVLWDGLTTPDYGRPGTPISAGHYSWRAIFHRKIGLTLRGWADNGGSPPWDNGPTTNWGGDHGVPDDCASDNDRVYLGWSDAESGKAVIATDREGNVIWRNPSGSLTAAQFVACDGSTLFVLNNDQTLFRLDTTTGKFEAWTGTGKSTIDPLTLDNTVAVHHVDGLAAGDGDVYLSYSDDNLIVAVDGNTGSFVRSFVVPHPGMMKIDSSGKLLIVSGGTSVIEMNPASGAQTTAVGGLVNAYGVAAASTGQIFVGERDPNNQIKEFDAGGRFVRAIGITGGRPIGATWNANGLRFAGGMTVDPSGQLWLAESNDLPKRISVWDTASGKFIREFFGPTHYGAVGGSIDPRDPNVMVGSGCEWRLDPKTGLARVTYVFPQPANQHPSNNGIGESVFAIGSNGRLYVAVSPAWADERSSVISIYERLGDANYKLRTTIAVDDVTHTTTVWSDENGDGVVQPSEEATYAGLYRFTGWYLDVSSSLTCFGNGVVAPVTGYTSCGAPQYNFNSAVKLSGVLPTFRGMPSPDGKQVLVESGWDGDEHGTFDCYDTSTNTKLWSYPDDFVSVHGSHNAPPSSAGNIYGSYGPVGSAHLPSPIGNIWVIPTNVGEWHILTQDGFYLSRLFQPDPLAVAWPEHAGPGSDMTDSPPGGGQEDFGGGIALGSDGQLYVEAGHTGYWNMVVTGLDTVHTLSSGKIDLTDDDVHVAAAFSESEKQTSEGQREMTIARGSISFTGNLANDFKVAEIISYEKGDDTAARSAAAYDDNSLYLAWDVRDQTPWVNGAGDPQSLYIGGDTVDFQLGENPSADPNRRDAVDGDLRLSIGDFHGKDIAELYRKVSSTKRPATFHSGVISSYPMDFVGTLSDVTIMVSKRSNGYTVEAAIPLNDLNLHPAPDLKLRGDFGVTFGDPAGQRTRIRSYWSNQHVGIVDDAVYELMLQPQYWGEILFK